MKPVLPLLRSTLALGTILLAGCISGSGGGGGGGGFGEGHYFIRGRFDASYAYEQYFVILPEGRYEWVEYGYNAASSQLCKVTRQTGAYDASDASLGIVVEKDAGPEVKCGFSQQDFQAMKWINRKDPTEADFEIRNATDSSFEARMFFDTTGAWKPIIRRPDPYGFYD